MVSHCPVFLDDHGTGEVERSVALETCQVLVVGKRPHDHVAVFRAPDFGIRFWLNGTGLDFLKHYILQVHRLAPQSASRSIHSHQQNCGLPAAL